MDTTPLLTDDTGKPHPRPLFIECRRGLDYWQYRAEWSYPAWANTWEGSTRPFSEIKFDLQLLHPDCLIVAPEEQGLFWQDC